MITNYMYYQHRAEDEEEYVSPKTFVDFILRLASFWVGWHYSPKNKRLCVNVIPCFTVAITFPGGVRPDKRHM